MNEPTENAQGQPGVPAGPSAVTPAAKRPWWWKVLGIRSRQGRWLRIKPTLWGWFLVACVLAVTGAASFAEYSMQPDFCRTCHLMEPYYQAWHASAHKNVPCGDCHFEPGLENTLKGKWQASSQAVKYITNTYGSKPHAEVRDESCMRSGCHEKRLLEGKVNWTVKNQQGQTVTIRFNHTPHLEESRRGLTLRCVSCHSQMVQGQHIVVTIDTCFLCHFKGLQHGRDDQTIGGCRACHDAPQGQIALGTGVFNHADYINRGVACLNCHSDSITGDGAVPKQLCWGCHNQPQQIARFSETSFIHGTHVNQHKVECASCHVQIRHSLSAAGEAGMGYPMPGGGHTAPEAGSCAQCHSKLHSAPLDMYRGEGGRGVPNMPSAMFRTQVDCIACHNTPVKDSSTAALTGQTFSAVQAACNRCHPSQYVDLLQQWKKALTVKIQQTQAILDAARSAMERATLTAPQQLELRRLLDDGDFNLNFVRKGQGLHNMTYATALLSVAVDGARKVLSVAAPEAPQPQIEMYPEFFDHPATQPATRPGTAPAPAPPANPPRPSP